MDIRDYSLAQLAAGLEKGEWTSLDLTEVCLAVAAANAETTHAYIETFDASAREAAKASDDRRKSGQSRGPLDGIPVALKDNMLYAGHRSAGGSKILEGFVAPDSATAVQRLLDAGAVILGRTSMDEFAMGSSSETCAYGAARNPWDRARVPGGSSGGSAVAVAEGSAAAAFGSDTGGSIRQPASLSGVTGFKPTYGRVSRSGLMAMSSSLDQIGPFARTAEDAALLTSVIEGADTLDQTTVQLRPEWKMPSSLPASLKGMRIGLPKEYFGPGMEPGVEKAVREAVAALVAQGAETVEVSLPHAEYGLAVYYVLMPCEVSANLARFDGMRFGARAAGATLDEVYRNSRGAGFGPEVRRRIMLGTFALSAGYYDAYYLKALKVRRRIADDFTKAFESVDLIVAPTSPTVAWEAGSKGDNPVTMYLSDVYTVSVNVAGLPGVSVPCGFAGGLPVGLQFIGPAFGDARVLGAASAYQQVTDWHTKKPALQEKFPKQN